MPGSSFTSTPLGHEDNLEDLFLGTAEVDHNTSCGVNKTHEWENLSSRMIRWVLKLSEFNIKWEHRPGSQNVVAKVLSRNPVDNVEGSQISCVVL
ncbi:hypothetical protein TNCV_1648001 [Trichonephila clavipes]|uniref:Uncharacterized protein n=1 Tax=Trichonephila clavipes TaxID=2585209 RepID=A0A8X6RUK5_TRICX|nr:hypothetical protein TNCV_1648001 [Trichonephila clavipes]